MPELSEIRPALRQDAAEMAALLNEIIAIGGTTAMERPMSVPDMVAKCIDNPALICCHVAVDDASTIAGFQYICRSEKLPDDVGEIATFARQTPKVRGVGTALMDATKKVCRAAGLTQINACIRADNVSGLAYYSKMGGVDYTVDKGVPLRDGTPIDRITKRLHL